MARRGSGRRRLVALWAPRWVQVVGLARCSVFEVARDVGHLALGHEGRGCKHRLLSLAEPVVHAAEKEAHQMGLFPHDRTVVAVGQLMQSAVDPPGKPADVVGRVPLHGADGAVDVVVITRDRRAEAAQLREEALLARQPRS